MRNTISELGYEEKGTEIDNGGVDITENIEKATSSILRTIKKELPNVSIKVTSGNDKYHQTVKYNSRHKKGNAVDITVIPATDINKNKVYNILQRYAAGNNPNFRFINEYANPTHAATGGHFHLSWGAGSESQKKVDKAILLAQEGKINPIQIV